MKLNTLWVALLSCLLMKKGCCYATARMTSVSCTQRVRIVLSFGWDLLLLLIMVCILHLFCGSKGMRNENSLFNLRIWSVPNLTYMMDLWQVPVPTSLWLLMTTISFLCHLMSALCASRCLKILYRLGVFSLTQKRPVWPFFFTAKLEAHFVGGWQPRWTD